MLGVFHVKQGITHGARTAGVPCRQAHCDVRCGCFGLAVVIGIHGERDVQVKSHWSRELFEERSCNRLGAVGLSARRDMSETNAGVFHVKQCSVRWTREPLGPGILPRVVGQGFGSGSHWESRGDSFLTRAQYSREEL